MTTLDQARPEIALLHQFTPFIGRVRECAAIRALLAAPNCRLLTLVGAGGIGKTRLAVKVTAAVGADLEPERYALICFVPDPETGKMHFMLGMVQEIEVE